MDLSYWRKQTSEEPLFPDILWSRPESKASSGKLAIIGGNAHGFSATGIAYNEALKSGVGICRVLLPDAIKKTVRHVLPDADYAPSTPSGSFSKKSLSELLSTASWSDACLLAGNFGRNSETAVVLEEFVKHHIGLLCVTQDAADYFKTTPRLLLDRPNTLVVLSLAQLQKYFINMPIITPITYSMTPLQLAEALHELTADIKGLITVKHHDEIFVAFDGQVVTVKNTDEIWRVKVSSRATVFWLQNPSKIFEAIVSSLI